MASIGQIRRVPAPGGGEQLIREIDFEIVHEDWSEYRLKDGGTVRLRATALKIARIVDENGKPLTTPDGDPAISVNPQIQVVASE